MMMWQQKYIYEKINLDPYLIPYTKHNLSWLIDLHVKAKTIKLVEKT